jgi:hypothetical protein
MSRKKGAQHMDFQECDISERLVNGCKKRRVDVITCLNDGNCPILGQFWTDSSIESPVFLLLTRQKNT